MYNYSELNAVKLSPTKKDFYQIWNELLDVASKLSERWDPTTTNESDPGIVLLKVLTAVADKINYSVDSNTLEAFMPSAAQDSSMRKLCEMLGYSMKYYLSATTDVKITYRGDFDANHPTVITIDSFSNIKDLDGTVNYVTLAPICLSKELKSMTVPCIEGTLISCEADGSEVISAANLDDNKRYYLPEVQVAENGTIVTNFIDTDQQQSAEWRKVTNLNTVPLGETVYKFGFDSQAGLPYLQFPEDVSNLIGSGLSIKYLRTNGIHGNVPVKALNTLERPASWDSSESSAAWQNLENYSIENISPARNGRNPESIDDAYFNYQRTIGTFDTLITCRDYMNKIYELTYSDTDTSNLVSNIIVSDIRDDINDSVKIRTLTKYGIEYEDIANDNMSSFELKLYPFTAIAGTGTAEEFINSFKFTDKNFLPIKTKLEDSGYSLAAHKLSIPQKSSENIACIKIYFKLNAKINTVKKVSEIEAAEIEQIAHTALFKAFNMRKINLGEELPYDSILHVIETCDPRIKSVSLDDPELSLSVGTTAGTDCEILSADGVLSTSASAVKFYSTLVLREVLAGRVALLNYDQSFKTSYEEQDVNYYSANALYPKFEVALDAGELREAAVLAGAEAIQFRRPNLVDNVIHSAYTNYFLHLGSGTGYGGTSAVPATMQTLYEWFNGGWTKDGAKEQLGSESLVWSAAISWNEKLAGLSTYLSSENSSVTVSSMMEEIEEPGEFEDLFEEYGAVFTQDVTSGNFVYYTGSTPAPEKLYHFKNSTDSFIILYRWFAAVSSGSFSLDLRPFRVYSIDTTSLPALAPDLTGVAIYACRSEAVAQQGKLIDSLGKQYVSVKSVTLFELSDFYIPELWANNTTLHTKNGLGADASGRYIPANTDYELKSGDYLLISYEEASTTSDNTVQRNTVYSAGDIIRPNFNLQDSTNSTKKFDKTSNAGPWQVGDTSIQLAESGAAANTIRGMYTMGATEQICKRSLAEVTIDDSATYIYWIRQDETPDDQGNIIFTYDEDSGYSYTLKADEFIFLTGADKESLAYYGAGTKITRGENTPTLQKNIANEQPTMSEISELGLLAAIPWQKVNLSIANAALTILEYEYITLAAGDTLFSLELTDGLATLTDIWKLVDASSVSYQTADGVYGNLSEIIASNTTVGALTWQARSLLNLSLNASNALQLRNAGNKLKDFIEVTTPEGYRENIIPNDGENLFILADRTISCNSHTDTRLRELDDDGAIVRTDPLRLKEYKEAPVSIEVGGVATRVQFENYIDGFTSVQFKDISADGTLDLNINIQDNRYGLITIFVDDGSSIPSVSAENGAGTSVSLQTFYDFVNNVSTGTFSLKTGLNTIVLTPDCKKLSLGRQGSTDNPTIIFSNLQLFYADDDGCYLNSRLGLSSSNCATALDVLEDLDPHSRYLHLPDGYDQERVLDLNAEDGSLLQVKSWFDANLVDNKFIVSELNARAVQRNVTVSKSSRR